MKDESFAIFIITHGRPDNQITVSTLKRIGYSGKLYLVVDNLDPTLDAYMSKYDNVLIFNKLEYVNLTDCAVETPMINFAVFARNAVEQFARELNLQTFIIMDDDITNIRIRLQVGKSLKSYKINDFTKFTSIVSDYMLTANITCIGFSRGLFGGVSGLKQMLNGRCAFSIIFRNAQNEVKWKSNVLEDLITSVELGISSNVVIKLYQFQFDMLPTGIANPNLGGNSEVYKTFDKFKLMFFPIVFRPSCWYINDTAIKNRNLGCGPKLNIKNAVPKIISSSYKNSNYS